MHTRALTEQMAGTLGLVLALDWPSSASFCSQPPTAVFSESRVCERGELCAGTVCALYFGCILQPFPGYRANWLSHRFLGSPYPPEPIPPSFGLFHQAGKYSLEPGTRATTRARHIIFGTHRCPQHRVARYDTRGSRRGLIPGHLPN